VPKTVQAMAKQPAGLELYEHEWIAAQISALTDGHLNRLDRPNPIGFLTELIGVVLTGALS
jgi:hypothetical protein